jgi:hypothetical protein
MRRKWNVTDSIGSLEFTAKPNFRRPVVLRKPLFPTNVFSGRRIKVVTVLGAIGRQAYAFCT